MAEVKQFVRIFGEEHPVQKLCGWGVWKDELDFDEEATKELVRSNFDLWSDPKQEDPVKKRLFNPIHIVGAMPYSAAAASRSMLWEVGRKVIGTDPLNYPQEVGDCVSFGAKNGIEFTQFFPLANGNQQAVWTMVFPPYLWGMGRLAPDCGDNQLGGQDGSVGAWQAKAVNEYGSIALKADGVPEYSGSIARKWGNRPGPDQKWVDQGKLHIVKTAAAVQTWADVVQALVNGYPCTIASNVGFDMTPRKDGFHHYSTHWGHQMCIVGVDDDPGDPYACILNSWGDVHGEVKDFKTGDKWPIGTLRVRKGDVESILAERDSFAYSAYDLFVAQDIDRDKFDLW